MILLINTHGKKMHELLCIYYALVNECVTTFMSLP